MVELLIISVGVLFAGGYMITKDVDKVKEENYMLKKQWLTIKIELEQIKQHIEENQNG